ncbi:MAG: DUF3604 domain-containing protein [Planctomycetes bacterium]|nr:DUF3604 domain-containing protein [Planctomycetota bacterium]
MGNKIGTVVRSCIFLLLCLALLATGALAQDTAGEAGSTSNKPNPLRNVYFGEQHLHTRNSPDAFASGSRQTWDEAFRYGRGEEVTLHTTATNNKIKRGTPYDFMAVTDHAEYFSVMPRLIDPKDPLSKTDFAKKLQANDPSAVQTILHSILTSTAMPEYVTPKMLKDNWQDYIKVANKYNDPGKFTTLIAFEWTSIPNGRNMHRNVFFRNDSGPRAPYSAFDSFHPEDLWTYLEVQRNAGNECFAIPHNGNVSDGWMYSPNKFLGGPMDARYAERQAANEPLTEIIQTKGSSDTHPLMSPNDEFANFELFPNLINVGQPSQIKYGYIRQGLVEGMILEDKLGTNPFKMGIVSGADSHSGYSNNEEFNFHGSHGALEDTPKKRLNPVSDAAGDIPARLGSAGATAVWAEENTRASIFDAMKRRETYGTSGTLIRLRFFGGWDYDKNLINDKDFVKKAYAGGVPMGSDLPKKSGKAPTFAVWALKDPESGNLDRIQIIKGFINKWGRTDEKIYDIALSDDRKADPKTGKIPPVGNTVNVKKATYTNDIGDSQLSVVWADPDFDPRQKAVYYVRVLEIPTPRWSTYDAVKSGLPIPEGIPATLQERAWSSPIWYTPAATKTAKK